MKGKIDTFLHVAAENGNSRQVKAAVENQHYDVLARDDIGETPLHKAVRCGMNNPPARADYPGTIRYLLDQISSIDDVNADIKNQILESCLELAASFATADIISMLTKTEIDINQFTSYEMFACAAARSKNPEVFQALVIALKPNESVLSQALCYNVRLTRINAAKVLLDAGADPLNPVEKVQHSRQRSALEIAATTNDRRLIKLVISYIK